MKQETIRKISHHTRRNVFCRLASVAAQSEAQRADQDRRRPLLQQSNVQSIAVESRFETGHRRSSKSTACEKGSAG